MNDYEELAGRFVLGELGPAQRAELERLATGDPRRRRELDELEGLAELLAAARQTPRPVVPDGFWSRLEARLETPVVATLPPRRSSRPLLAAAASLLLLVGFVAGWLARPDRQRTVVARPAPAGATAVLPAGGELLRRVEPLLLSLANRDPGRSPFDATERLLAERLAAEAKRCAEVSRAARDRRTADLLDELAVLLLQLANLNPRDYAEGSALVAASIDGQSLLLRLQLWELRRGAERPRGA